MKCFVVSCRQKGSRENPQAAREGSAREAGLLHTPVKPELQVVPVLPPWGTANRQSALGLQWGQSFTG